MEPRPANTAGVAGSRASRGSVRPPSQQEHLMGQVARGEVRIGRDAAREIAARHEAEYGDAFDS
jgi:hypothetical protein